MTARPLLADALHAAWGYGRTPWPALRAGQDAALRRLVLHAYEQVRYYRRLFDRHRLHPRHLRGAVDLELIPITGRDDLRAHRAADLLARGTDPAALIRSETPDRAEPPRYRTWLEDLLQLVHRARALAALGVQPGDRIGVVGPGDGERHAVALQLLGHRRRRFFPEAGEPAAIAAAVAGFAPDVLVGAPAALGRVAAAAVGGPVPLAPRLVVVEGRPPMPRLRARLSDAFGGAVRATYGLGTDTLLAAECGETGGFHVADGWALLEVLVGDRPAAPGERGEIVVTLLHSYAMPILRHRLGHLATRGGPCPCGASCSTILAPDA